MTNKYNRFLTTVRLTIDPSTDLIESCYNYIAQQTNMSLDKAKDVYNLKSLKILKNCSGCENKLSEQYHHMGCPFGCKHDPNFCLYCE